MDSGLLSYVQTEPFYPEPPFHPGEPYPEYSGPKQSKNLVYDSVRTIFKNLELDIDHYGTKSWNPLGELIHPGEKVVLKPNLVTHINYGGGPLEPVVTHGSIIRATLDYVLIALKGSGTVRIVDSPQMEADFPTIVKSNGLDKVVSYIRHSPFIGDTKVELYDLRQEKTYFGLFSITKRERLANDPLGYADVDLKDNSEMRGLDSRLLYGADYNRDIIVRAHSHSHHRYVISRSVLDCDVFISLPKLKTHKKVGVTLNIKNLVGICGDKNFIPHFSIGAPENSGDEYPQSFFLDYLNRKLTDFFLGRHEKWGRIPYFLWGLLYYPSRKMFRHGINDVDAGNWYGNDTTWRAALDLAKIALYADKTGRMTDKIQRRYLAIVDGIIGGQGNGPLAPAPAPAGLVVGGFSPLATDLLSARLMGFDYRKIKTLINGLMLKVLYLCDNINTYKVVDTSGKKRLKNFLVDKSAVTNLAFRPHDRWIGHIELTD